MISKIHFINKITMAEFLSAQKKILSNEGGYVFDPSDNGGETYCGISRKNFPNWDGWKNIDELKPLDRGEVVSSFVVASEVNTFYKANFWDKMLGDSITEQPIAEYLYDFYVNAGRNALKCLQRIVGVTDDGVFGNGTLNALNEYAGDLLAELHKSRLEYYNSIAVGSNARFLTGWNNRANNLYNLLS